MQFPADSARRSKPMLWTAAVSLAALYYVFGRLGLSFAVVHESASAFWPPSGLAIAALFAFGKRLWPAVWLGAFLVNWQQSGGAVSSVFIGAGNALEVVAIVWGAERFAGGRRAFDSPRGIGRYLGCVLAGAAIAAGVGTLVLCVSGQAGTAEAPDIFKTWWFGDALSGIIFAPCLMFWFSSPSFPRRDWRAAAGAAAAVFVMSMVLFGGWLPSYAVNYPLAYLIFPIVVMIAFRFEEKGAAAACLAFSLFAIGGTRAGYGVFAPHEPNTALALLQIFLATTALTAILTGSLVRHRRAAERRIEQLNADLEKRLIELERTVRDVKQARQELEKSEHIYRAIGETIDWGIWICAPDGRNLYASESFLKMVGLTQKQCSEFGWGEVLHPDDAAATIAAWKRCVAEGSAWYREHRFKGVDGKWHHVLARGTAVRNDHGEIVCWAGINLDVDGLKEAEERVRTVVENMPVLLTAFDENGRIVAWNAECERVTGYQAREIVGNPRAMEILYPDAGYRTRMIEEWSRKKIYRNWEWEMTCKEGQTRTIAWSNISARYPIPGWFTWGIGVDVTDRKNFERTLEARVEERTEELRLKSENLARFNSLMVNRELDMVRLKKEVNDLLASTGREPKYGKGPESGELDEAARESVG